MKEHVGVCHMCNKDIYCLNGFLNGTTDDEGRLTCFECANNDKGNGGFLSTVITRGYAERFVP